MQRLLSSPRLSSAVRLAEVHAFHGNTEEAFKALETAGARITPQSWSSPDGTWIEQWRFSPFLRPLHADARWAIMRPSSPPFTVVAR